MTPDDVVWWCWKERRIIDLHDMNRPDCGPELQCTGGRRENLPCGWHRIVPAEGPADGGA